MIFYSFYTSPFGQLLIACRDNAVCFAHFVDGDQKMSLQQLRKEFAQKTLREDSPPVATIVDPFFLHQQQIPVLISGTPFAQEVLTVVCSIPFGTCVSYSDFAAKIGKPRTVRAVARTVARNSIALFVPCHRIIKKDGIIHKYRWGSHRKKNILLWESTNTR